MKSIAAVLLSALLCVQPVYAAPVCAVSERETVLYTDTQEKEADVKKDTDTQENPKVQKMTDTQEGVEALKDDGEGEDQEETGVQEKSEIQGQEDAGDGIAVSAPSAVLMEASTGQVIFEKDADTKRPPASVTKVMTLLLIFDALNDGKIRLEDTVTTSEYAASMGGSQVFLEPGETQTVDTMIKCISVASANDACAAFKYSRQCTNERKSAGHL